MKEQIRLFAAAVLVAAPTFLLSPSVGEQDSRSKSFTVSKGGNLEVTVDGGDIRINVWEKNEVLVQVEGIDEEDLDRLKMNQRGNTVRVEFRRHGGWWSDGHMRFDVTVPSEFNAELRTSGGDIDVRGSLNGTIKGATSGGNVTLGNLKGGKVDLSTSGGDMRTGDIQGDVTLRTSGGDIELGKVGGEVSVSTSGGDIRVESVGKKLKASTSGGNIDVGDVGGEARVSTSGGDIKVRKVSGSASLSTSGGDIQLESASGEVKAHTSGGDVRLEDITGSVEAATSGGTVDAELKPTGKGKSRLTSSGGEITLYIPENAKATIEATIRIQGRWKSRKGEYKVRSDFKAESYEQNEDDEEIRAKYVLNGGGEDIRLETVNSDIKILKLRK
ncbi:MAG: DUF4097 family beta strand repeat-containing protein [Bacteroidota bacterium]